MVRTLCVEDRQVKVNAQSRVNVNGQAKRGAGIRPLYESSLLNVVKTWNVGAAECGSGLRGCGVNFAELRTRPQLIGCALT